MKLSTMMILLLLLLFTTTTNFTSATRLLLHQAENSNVGDADVIPTVQIDPEENDFNNLMGGVELIEGCSNDEECVKRRIIAEAHLDYIYTQNHNP